MVPANRDSDILILGAGGAGLFAALHAHKAAPELSITVAVKGLLGKCGCTRMVQGGYNVALAKEDSIERHFMDTIEGGKWLPDQDLAWKLVTLAVEMVRELENELGCFFDRNPDGTVHQKAFAGQTFDLITAFEASASDAHPLIGACNTPNCVVATLSAAGLQDVQVVTTDHLARAWRRRRLTDDEMAKRRVR